MKLIIQIPCFNERDHLEAALAELPRSLPGIDEIEVLVIDDGSTDGTSEVARRCGVHHVVRFSRNQGLATAYAAGLDAALRLGADLIVNTDADNQYRAADIEKLLVPILRGEADIVIGDRQTDTIAHFSPLKKWLQKAGSRVVRGFSGTRVADATSGFRAVSRHAALRLFVHNRFSYTLETIIQAGQAGLAISNVPVRTNPVARPSRLARSMGDYVRRNGPIILRAYAMYRPAQTFSYMAAALLLLGGALGARFLYFYLRNPEVSGHVQSLMVGVGAVILAFITGLMALLGDLLAANRRLNEEMLARLRRLDAQLASLSNGHLPGRTDGIDSTGEPPWRRPPP